MNITEKLEHALKPINDPRISVDTGGIYLDGKLFAPLVGGQLYLGIGPRKRPKREPGLAVYTKRVDVARLAPGDLMFRVAIPNPSAFWSKHGETISAAIAEHLIAEVDHWLEKDGVQS
ncbi:MAG: hypothetical protein WAO78_15335 [Roseovarius sp.]